MLLCEMSDNCCDIQAEPPILNAQCNSCYLILIAKVNDSRRDDPPMDLNLLRVLDTLLQESSVTAAAERLGDLPAGREPITVAAAPDHRRPAAGACRPSLGAHPHALWPFATHCIRCSARPISCYVQEENSTPTTISETFTVQVSDLFLTSVADPLLETLQREAPGVNVIFLPETLEGTTALRRGDVDVELGVLSHLDPETRHQTLAETTLLGVARATNAVRRPPLAPRGSPAPLISASLAWQTTRPHRRRADPPRTTPSGGRRCPPATPAQCCSHDPQTWSP